MKIKAIIEYTDKDILSSVEDLKSILNGYEISNHTGCLEDDVFYIYFRNPYIRYPNLKDLINIITQVSDYPCVYYGKELVGISRKYIDKPYVLLNNFPVTFAKPNYPSIPILLYTHKRSDYLKLSLNSLLFSLGDDITDITIFMSSPSLDVENFVKEVSEGHPTIEVYRSEENIACAAINAFLQIKKPERFVIFEEDFILPQYTRFALPYWSRQFNYLLDKFDIVNFQTSIENQTFDFFRGSMNKSKRNTSFSFFHEWIINKNEDVHITGNGFAVKSDFYKSFGNNPPFYISGDGHVFSHSDKVCISSIHGYHIGWNQEMDGYVKISDKSRFPEPGTIQVVENFKTKQKYTIDLRKIIDS